jgi:hypothetical protein
VATIKGGSKFEAVLRDIAHKLGGKQVLRVGFLESGRYEDGTSIPMVAAINNYGTARIPPRPFFSNMVKDKSPEWPKGIAAQLKATDYDVTKTLNSTGDLIEGQLRDSIVNGVYAPLAQSTIDRKGFDKPLIDSHTMVNAPRHEIKS